MTWQWRETENRNCSQEVPVPLQNTYTQAHVHKLKTRQLTGDTERRCVMGDCKDMGFLEDMVH